MGINVYLFKTFTIKRIAIFYTVRRHSLFLNEVNFVILLLIYLDIFEQNFLGLRVSHISQDFKM